MVAISRPLLQAYSLNMQMDMLIVNVCLMSRYICEYLDADEGSRCSWRLNDPYWPQRRRVCSKDGKASGHVKLICLTTSRLKVSSQPSTEAYSNRKTKMRDD
ncbi:unnamed protein product [Protopolystoma xenopodis]|uniref:Uncharacterized protein n=1 Tax=Protopolystoma xenopodis TaxID=117903 RepID=A0A448XDE3_9PLAT|nr:unnamed protein product [Protopolystoma xenopodis]